MSEKFSDKPYLEFKTEEIKKASRPAGQDTEISHLLSGFGGLNKNKIEKIISDLNYMPFDPDKELKTLRKFLPAELALPLEERLNKRKERRRKYREEILWQKKGLEETLSAVSAALEKESDWPIHLWEIVRAKAPRYRFSVNQLALFDQGISNYWLKHNQVKDTASRYQTPALFEACFGKKPKGQVEVITGPMTITLRCYDFNDYVLASTYYLIAAGRPVTKEEKELVKLSAGRALSEVKLPALKDAVNIENASENKETRGSREVVKDEQWSKKIRVHEDQHQFNKLFRPLEYSFDSFETIYKILSRERPAQVILNELIIELARQKRRELGVDCQARDEIISYYQEGLSPEAIYNNLSSLSIYDYKNFYQEEIAKLPQAISDLLKQNLALIVPLEPPHEDVAVEEVKPPEINQKEIEEIVKAVFDVDYKIDLKKWTDNITALETSGYRREEIIGLLYQTPVNKWSNLVRRLEHRRRVLTKDLKLGS